MCLLIMASPAPTTWECPNNSVSIKEAISEWISTFASKETKIQRRREPCPHGTASQWQSCNLNPGLPSAEAHMISVPHFISEERMRFCFITKDLKRLVFCALLCLPLPSKACFLKHPTSQARKMGRHTDTLRHDRHSLSRMAAASLSGATHH